MSLPRGDTASKNAMLGIMYMCAAVALFPFLNSAVKYLNMDYPTAQIVWARYLGHFLFMVLLFMPKRGIGLFRTQAPKSQIVRSILLLCSTSLYFIALNFLPLTTAASISFSSPFIITALSVPLLGEKVGIRRWTAVCIGFLGMLLIVRPGSDVSHWAAWLVVGSSTSYALYTVLTRRMATHGDDAATTITYTAVVGAIVTSFIGPFVWVNPDNWLDWALFASMGIFGGLGHLFVVKSVQYAQASVVAPLGYGQLVGATLLGYFVFNQLPDALSWVGVAIIVACGIYIAYREGVKRQES
tara:strand:- start:308 stop:1204 length:897 start_codon:yes stop_codon:yes gene_type:complete